MIRDKNDKDLKPGDLVILRCQVLRADEGDFGIATLAPVEDVGGHTLTNAFTVNSKQVELISPEPITPNK